MQASLERFYEGMGGAAMRVARALGLALGRDQQWLARHCEKGPSPPRPASPRSRAPPRTVACCRTQGLPSCLQTAARAPAAAV